MGMYTGFKADILLDPNIPIEMFRTLGWMVSPSETAEAKVPNHALFQTQRWRSLFRMQSACFEDCRDVPSLQGHENGFRLQVASSIKNYQQEIQKFINWVFPYVIQGRIAFRYEEYPTWTVVDFQKPDGWDPSSGSSPRLAPKTVEV